MGAEQGWLGTGAAGAKQSHVAYVSPAFCTPLARPWFRRRAVLPTGLWRTARLAD
jgi:hypothetical protein